MSSTPRIAWDNQLTAATWTLSPVESGNDDPIGNAADVRPWTPASSSGRRQRWELFVGRRTADLSDGPVSTLSLAIRQCSQDVKNYATYN